MLTHLRGHLKPPLTIFGVLSQVTSLGVPFVCFAWGWASVVIAPHLGWVIERTIQWDLLSPQGSGSPSVWVTRQLMTKYNDGPRLTKLYYLSAYCACCVKWPHPLVWMPIFIYPFKLEEREKQGMSPWVSSNSHVLIRKAGDRRRPLPPNRGWAVSPWQCSTSLKVQCRKYAAPFPQRVVCSRNDPEIWVTVMSFPATVGHMCRGFCGEKTCSVVIHHKGHLWECDWGLNSDLGILYYFFCQNWKRYVLEGLLFI